MNHKHDHDNVHSPGVHLKSVLFEFKHPTATAVSVAGTFNDWNPDSKNMHQSGKGHWIKETTLAPGKYEYCLVVDGQWISDPLAKECVPNPFGGNNSVLVVTA